MIYIYTYIYTHPECGGHHLQKILLTVISTIFPVISGPFFRISESDQLLTSDLEHPRILHGRRSPDGMNNEWNVMEPISWVATLLQL